MRRRIGQLLSEIVPLTDHDVEDILQEQKSTRQRFGDAALALGMVAPQHVWQAWIRQIESDRTEIDLDEVGVDTQILNQLPRQIIQEYQVLPIRIGDNEVAIACSHPLDDVSKNAIQNDLDLHAVFVMTHPGQVEKAITQHLGHVPHRTAAA